MSRLPPIPGVHVKKRDIPKYVWNADLVELEGPLLSLYRSDEAGDALYTWLDCDERRHRWAIVPVLRNQLRDFLGGSISLRFLMEDASQIIVFDSAGPESRTSRYIQTTAGKLPNGYMPEVESYFDESIATDAALQLARESVAQYSLGLSGELYLEDVSAISRLYQQLYSFHYGLSHTNRLAVRRKLMQMFEEWRGGISGVNIFSGLRSVTPSIHRPRLCELKYNSPGHIKLELLPDLAEEIAKSVAKVMRDPVHRDLEGLYGDIYGYFREQKISGFDTEGGPISRMLSPDQTVRLQQYVEKFFLLMGWRRLAPRFVDLDASPLGQLRILLAYYRRLRQLREFVASEKLTVPRR